MNLGSDTGAPRDRVRFSLSTDPRRPVTRPACAFRCESSRRILEKIERIDHARLNGSYYLEH